MSNPFVGEIRLFAGNFAPYGWMICDGQLLPISEHETLFQLIGTIYGGDGESTFALPNMQSRVPVLAGTRAGVTYQLGEMAGEEQVTLSLSQIPIHSHGMRCSPYPASGSYTASTGVLGKTAGASIYALTGSGAGAMKADSVLPAGGNEPHSNIAPYLGLNYIISLYGVFPQQT